MNSKLGFSIYLSSGLEKNIQILNYLSKKNVKYLFTSFQIPEDNLEDYIEQMKFIMKWCKNNNINLYADVSPRTLTGLKLDSFEILYKYGITGLRFDFGIDYIDIANISQEHKVMINASSISEKEIQLLIENKVNLDNVIACHNFYPKLYSGLSTEYFKKQNALLKKYKIDIAAFIIGDREKREPFYDGLPTLETQRHLTTLESAIQMQCNYDIDYIIVGDISVQDRTFNDLIQLFQNKLNLHVINKNIPKQMLNKELKCRTDLSPYLIRVDNTRKCIKANPVCANEKEKYYFSKGTILMCNYKFGRYNGEIEILLHDIPYDERYNEIGKIKENSLPLLKYIDGNKAFILIEDEERI